MRQKHVEIISNAATKRWICALDKSRAAFEEFGLPRYYGAPDAMLYDIHEIADAASKIVDRKSKREPGQSIEYHIHTVKGGDGNENVVVEWYQ